MKKLFLAVFIMCALVWGQRRKNIIKVGCIDIQTIINKIAASKILKKKLSDKRGRFLSKAEKLSKEIQQLKQVLEVEEQVLSKERRLEIKSQILEKEQELNKYLQERETFIKQSEDLLTPDIVEEIYAFVKEVAVREGFSIIIEKNTAVIYSIDDLDITEDVIELIEESETKDTDN
ncbi:MAG TPA: OmpH family outer membrane protein [Spirochaetota bacterium]|nr:OmpH family outer membrane protein [Spirochaetota bacterium]